MYAWLKDRADFILTRRCSISKKREDGYQVICEEENYACGKCGFCRTKREANGWKKVCEEMGIPTSSNRVDLGVRVWSFRL